MLLLGEEHLDAGEDQEAGKDGEQPVKLGNQPGTDHDHHAPHRDRPENAPEEHPMLIHRRHRQRAEDHRDHEDVVDTQ